MTYLDLMNDKYAWALGLRFGKKLHMDYDEIKSEIYYIVAKVNDMIEQRKVKFDYSDEEDVLKYYRYSVRSRFFRLLRYKSQECQLADYEWDYLNYRKWVCDLGPKKVVSRLCNRKMYNYIINNSTKQVQQNLVNGYRKFGKKFIVLLYRCLCVDEKCGRRIAMKVRLTNNELKWLCYLVGKEKVDDLFSNVGDVKKYASSCDTPFKRRVLEWINSGMEVDEDVVNDCFGYGYDSNDKEDCGRCVIATGIDGCKEATEFNINKFEKEIKEDTMKNKERKVATKDKITSKDQWLKQHLNVKERCAWFGYYLEKDDDGFVLVFHPKRNRVKVWISGKYVDKFKDKVELRNIRGPLYGCEVELDKIDILKT